MRKTKRGHLPAMPQGRRQRGNMIALVGAICGGLLLALLLFALAYTRLLGGNQEQKTAIEAASLAAAKDIGRIVLKNDHFGWIGLSDYAPTGVLTKAPDGTFQSVYSMNTILATIRLDMILEDEISKATGNPSSMATWRLLADQDYAAAMKAKDALNNLLSNAILPGGDPNAKDIQGNIVTPYNSAEQAYKQNDLRQNESAYVNGSLKLTLGCVQDGSETTVGVPYPSSKASISSPTQNGKYMSYTNYQYKGKDFVFSGTGATLKLIDPKKFKTSLPLPYFIPGVVMAEADQKLFKNGDKSKPAGITHSVACAQSFCNTDPKVAPGMAIFEPGVDGQVPASIDRPSDWLNQSQLTNSTNPGDVFTPRGGDYNGPGSTGTLVSDTSLGSSTLPPANGLAAAVYDWLRLGGHKVNIDSVVAMINGAGIPGGKFKSNTVYKWAIDANGNIVISTAGATKEPYLAISENQLYMECGDAMDEIDASTGSKTSPWALYMKDQSRKWGEIFGGQHAGQPLPVPSGSNLASVVGEKWIACLPEALPDSAIAMNGANGTAKLGEFGAMGSGANHKKGGTVATTPLPVYRLDDFAEPGITGLNFPYTSGAPASGIMPPTYLQNGVAAYIRFRVEMANIATPTKEGHIKK